MNVNLHFSFNCFWTLLLHPASCIIFKQVFQINIVVLTSLNSTSKPCQVSNIFSYYLLTVNLSWTVLQAIKNINHLANPLIEFSEVFISPPVIHISVFIKFSTTIIKGMRNFMTNSCTNTTVICTTGLMNIIKWRLQNTSWES
ncbi:MAG: hypothetical protein ACFWTT_00795 [Lactobacillus delbrueckii]